MQPRSEETWLMADSCGMFDHELNRNTNAQERSEIAGRGERIRTSDPLLPRQVR